MEFEECGVLWFYHIPETGGGVVAEWVIRHSSVKMVDFYAPAWPEGNFDWWKPRIEEIREKASTLSTYLFVNHHNFAPGQTFQTRLFY